MPKWKISEPAHLTRDPHSQLSVVVESAAQRVRLFVTPWTAAHQAPPSMGLSREEHWSGEPFPSPEKNIH